MLTKNQRAVLDAVIDYTREQGATPVLRQIQDRCGLAQSSTQHALGRLQLEGYVEQDGRHASYAPRKTHTGATLTITITEEFDT